MIEDMHCQHEGCEGRILFDTWWGGPDEVTCPVCGTVFDVDRDDTWNPDTEEEGYTVSLVEKNQ